MMYHYRLWKEGMTEDDEVWLTSETDPPSRLPEGFTHYVLLGVWSSGTVSNERSQAEE